jgi:DNA-binding PadR family transcriptional regulator
LGGSFLKSEILEDMRRSIVRNFLDTIILAKLKNSSSLGGYDITEFIYKKFGVLISPGTVYAVLYSMERRGLIKGERTEGKRIYVLTGQGAGAVNAILESKETIQRFIGTCISC